MHYNKWKVCFLDEGTSNAIDVSDSEESYVDEMGVGLSSWLFATSKDKELVSISATTSTSGESEGIPFIIFIVLNSFEIINKKLYPYFKGE